MLPPSLHRLILDQATAYVYYTEAERQQFRRQLCGDTHYQIWLQQQGVTSEQLEAWIDRELLIRKFQHQQWGKRLHSYFLERKHQIDRVVCSLIYLRSPEVAQELYFRIAEGEQDFTAVARAYSEGAEAEQGGTLGPIELGELHPKLARMFYGGYEGQLWEPTELNEWIVIARLDRILPVHLDDSMQQILLNELLETWVQEQIQQP